MRHWILETNWDKVHKSTPGRSADSSVHWSGLKPLHCAKQSARHRGIVCNWRNEALFWTEHCCLLPKQQHKTGTDQNTGPFFVYGKGGWCWCGRSTHTPQGKHILLASFSEQMPHSIGMHKCWASLWVHWLVWSWSRKSKRSYDPGKKVKLNLTLVKHGVSGMSKTLTQRLGNDPRFSLLRWKFPRTN